jgi:2-oxoglutarate ferredoxin oxidoreductase subunit delta
VVQLHIDDVVCKGCGLCIYYCPRDVFEFTDKRNGKGYTIVDVVNLSECTVCRLCEIGCPDFAIFIETDSK